MLRLLFVRDVELPVRVVQERNTSKRNHTAKVQQKRHFIFCGKKDSTVLLQH